MTIRSAVLDRGNFTGTSQTIVTTVPTGHVWIVKGSFLWNDPAGAVTEVWLRQIGVDGHVQQVDRMISAQLDDRSDNDPINWVFMAGDSLALQCSVASIIHWQLVGSDLV